MKPERLLPPILVLALTSCVAMQPTGGDVEPQPGEVPFEMSGPGGAALTVPVRINDSGPFPFVLDTGATVTCVDETLADELKLPEPVGTIGVGGGLEGLGRMRLVSLDSVTLGGATVRNLRGCAVDLASMQKVGLDVRGLLGLNFLREYRVTLDFARQTVRLEPPSAGGTTPGQ